MSQHTTDARIDVDGTLAVQHTGGQPSFGARIVRRRPKHGAPAPDLIGRHTGNVADDALAECDADVALRVDEPDDDRFSDASISWTASGRTNAAPHFIHRCSGPPRTRMSPRNVITNWTQ